MNKRSKDQHLSEIKSFCNIIHYTIQKLGVSIILFIFNIYIEINTFFAAPVPCCINSKCICAHLCAHGRAGLKTRCVQAHCYFEATQIDCTVYQLKPGLKSMAQYLFILVIKERVCNMRP